LKSAAATRLLQLAGRADLVERGGASGREAHPTRPADPDFQTVILVEGDRVWTRSGAALEVLRRLGGPWAVLSAVLRVAPSPLMDLAYSAVARRRYRWFGRRPVCRVAAEAERARFL
jgi:predicted DCC family thiol-disulfide oxidoreductase YuxK